MEKDIIDTGLLGYQIREARTKAGYATAEDFAAAITEATGVPVSKQTLYNIESGKQEPRLTLYLAILRLLNPDETLPVDDMLRASLPARWRIPLSVARGIDEENTAGDNDDNENTDGTADSDDTSTADAKADHFASLYDGLLKSVNTDAVRKAASQAAAEFTKTLNSEKLRQAAADAVPATREAMSNLASTVTNSPAFTKTASGLSEALKTMSEKVQPKGTVESESVPAEPAEQASQEENPDEQSAS